MSRKIQRGKIGLQGKWGGEATRGYQIVGLSISYIIIVIITINMHQSIDNVRPR